MNSRKDGYGLQAKVAALRAIFLHESSMRGGQRHRLVIAGQAISPLDVAEEEYPQMAHSH